VKTSLWSNFVSRYIIVTMIKINLKKAVEFFDSRGEVQRNWNASAIIGLIGEDLCVSAFKHYYRGKAKDYPQFPVTQRNRHGRGPRLDRWISVKSNIGENILYQTEVKNWSASAINGLPLSLNASNKEISDICNKLITRQLVAGMKNTLLNKVLIKMRVPDQLQGVKRVEPLVIFWMPMQKNGKFLFEGTPKKFGFRGKTPFKQLTVFSVSMYFRKLIRQGKKVIELDMPRVETRIRILRGLTSIM